MDLEDAAEMSQDPRFIPGIYNFCDRWCERCPYTSRCFGYAFGEQLEAELEERKRTRSDAENAAFWDAMDDKVSAAAELADEEAEGWADGSTLDQEIDEEDFEAWQAEHDEREEEARRHPAARAAWRYMRMAERWHEQFDPQVEKALEAMDQPAPDDPEAPDPGERAAVLHDAIDVIGWYEHYLWVKLMRALHRSPWEDEIWGDDDDEYDLDSDEPYLPRDSDVSAKLALIGMDRSVAAWGDVRSVLPQTAESATRMIVHLVRLRRMVEAEFPKARGIVRPGFDTPPPPLPDATG